MIAPPRWIERILSACGAEPRYRDGLLGDLAEEFTIRVEEQGVRVARRWYRREALRSVPHLLLSCLRGVRALDLARLLAVTALVVIATRLAGIATQLAIVMPLGVHPDSLAIVNVAWRDVVTEMVVLKWVALFLMRSTTVFGGFVAASLYPRSRIAGAFGVACVLSGSLAWLLASKWTIAPSAIIVLPVLNAGLVMIGGVLRVLVSRDAPVTRPSAELIM